MMIALEVLILITTSFLLLYTILKKNANYWKAKGVAFEKPLPLIGNVAEALFLKKSLGLIFSDLYFKFNEKYFGIWIFNMPQFVVRCPDLIKQILVKDFDKFYDRNVTNNEKVDVITSNLMFFLKNPKWRTIRTNTTVIFSTGKMKFIYPQMQAIAKNMAFFINDRNRDILEAKNVAGKYATDVICSAAFGIDAHSFQEKDTVFVAAGKTIFGHSLENAFTSLTYFCKSSLVDIFRIRFIKKWVADFFNTSFMDILKEREIAASNRKDLVDIIINFKKEFNLKDYELVAIAAQFFIAGYETTSSTIAVTLYELALNKYIQEKLREEINENIDESGDISYTNLNNMDYLDKILCESLRKYPPLPFLGRVCVNDYKIPDCDVIIEKGTPVIISLMGLHYDPKYFPDPNTFDPERFSQENMKGRHQYCYLPFGEGPRNCIGRRMGLLSAKIAVCQIIRNFEVEVCKRTKIPLEFNERSFTLCANDIYLNFKKFNKVCYTQI